MSIMEKIYARAKAAPQRIAFPEAIEEKILLAACQSADKGICHPLLVGNPAMIRDAAANLDISLDGITILDAFDETLLDGYIQKYLETGTLNSAKTMKRKAKDPLYTALMLEAIGEADCTFAGINYTTGDVIMAAQFVIGLQDGVTTPSSVAVFDIPGYDGPEGTLLGFGDSAVCENPSAEELAGIAVSACDSMHSLLGWEPRCALLSYSTTGSAGGPLVDKVVEAVKLANERRPDLAIDGEFQLDAAISAKVAEKKVKRDSRVAGKANIIIWPDLNVGNVGVKLVQVFAHGNAYGPMLQGFKKTVSDCSRSASVSELVGNIAMTCVRAQGGK